MIHLDENAERRLDEYIGQLWESLSACTLVDPLEVEADVRDHIERELQGAGEPVTVDALEAVLDRLGSPSQWVPTESTSADQAPRRRPEPWMRRIHRALLAAGLALVVGVPIIYLGFVVAGVAPWQHDVAEEQLVRALLPDLPIWLAVVGAVLAATASVWTPVSGGRFRLAARSMVARALVLAVLAAACFVAMAVVDRAIDGRYRSLLLANQVRYWTFTMGGLAAVWLVPWVIYALACHYAAAVQTQRADAQRAYLLGLLLWAPLLAVLVFAVSAIADVLDMRMVVPAATGLTMAATVGLSSLVFRPWPAKSLLLRIRDVASLGGRAALAVAAGLLPMLLFAGRDLHRLSRWNSYTSIRQIVVNGAFYGLAGVLLGTALAYRRWRRERWRREGSHKALGHNELPSGRYVAPALGLASLVLIVVAVIRDAQLLRAYTTFQVPLLQSFNRPAPTLNLGLLLLLGAMLVISTTGLVYVAGRMLSVVLTRKPAAHQAECPQARAKRVSI